MLNYFRFSFNLFRDILKDLITNLQALNQQALNQQTIVLKFFLQGAPNLEVLPKTGYYADGFPFKGQDSYQTPPVAVKIPQKGNYKIKCELSGDGIKTSDVFIAHRAYGKIEFEVSS